MIGEGLLIVAVLSSSVLSLPVTSGQLENDDVEVMKCVVEALAEVLSRPHPVPVSEECLLTLRTDDKLVAILRHRNFLKELQEIAAQGGLERAQLQGGTDTPEHVTQIPPSSDDIADRSMLEALGGPGERSILTQERKRNRDEGNEQEENQRDGESQRDKDARGDTEAKRESGEISESRASESVDSWLRGRDEESDGEEEREAKRINKKMEDIMKGAGANEKRGASKNKSKEKKFHREGDESAIFSRNQEDDEGEVKRGSSESPKRWTKRAKGLLLKKKAVAQEGKSPEQPSHSKEVTEEDLLQNKRNIQRSPEEKELHMIAQRAPEERRVSEEEGSAGRKSEEPEIESLAAIESELENVAQKLHELRRG